jgi:hypothetical protein
MPTRRRPAYTTPDLFAIRPAAEAPEAPAARRDAEPGHPAPRPRHLLPKDLAGALARLGDDEVDGLLVAVTAEARRRGRPVPASKREPTPEATAGVTHAASDVGGLADDRQAERGARRLPGRRQARRDRAAVRDLAS